MSVLPPPPERRSRVPGLLFVIWVLAFVVVVVERQIHSLLNRAGIPTGLLTFMAFLAALALIAISLYWLALAVRWLMRKLFWRVGRRLFLSYVLIGLLPFVLMTVLLLACAYMVAGVMSAAALRGERSATLGQMESAAMEYAFTGQKPTGALPSLEIYDTDRSSGKKIPEWLTQNSFSGIVWRNSIPLLVTSRQIRQAGDEEKNRTIVFAQPIDRYWARQLEDDGGMIIAYDRDEDEEEDKPASGKGHTVSGTINGQAVNEYVPGGGLDDVFRRGFRLNRVIWGDAAESVDWEKGTAIHHGILTFISNPITNLFHFYFGATADQYVHVLTVFILSLCVLLLLIYVMAALFAGVLIYSISRAVNRIEKGTKAVERGDFSYRIGMLRHNQLGEMAQSFDRMTESISSLLVTVAEKERLQSEIEIAATIQRNLLPKEGPQFSGVSFAAHFEPTASIGGDYYDVFNLDKSRLAVAIGDVSGHGLSTGLVMAMVKAAITTLVEEGAEEESLFRRLNDLVFRSTERRAFMTLAFTIFDLEKGTIRHTNAGHLYPYLLRSGCTAPVSIECPSLPLGVRSELTTHTVEMKLEEGDSVVYLSDGIIEAQNPDGDPFGFDQLEALLGDSCEQPPNIVRDSILHAIARHSGNRPADDDRTIMIVRFDNFRMSKLFKPQPLEIAAVEAATADPIVLTS